ncbi:sigma-70 family RNA polymerase sigma factor [Methylobacillus gramineus]|uniref:sigma-70 family RNA polymerase sigma factor n=1 Tax=Methylobacillus gramineus TaxID=755169 RepID=UPI001CFFD288|nr:sigma-70 family RNA polymerase sigma factor [Methylobacillus gramineus]MCB5185762.1 sigma-70 family RNA polymerase sigma factor [Methylobacillus gramineus]
MSTLQSNLPDPSLQAEVEQLYAHHHGWLRSWLRRQLHCRENAADLAHDTFIRVIAARNAKSILEPRVYLATVARRVMVDYFRRSALERAYLDALASLPEPVQISVEERTIVIETLCEIDAMLDALGEKPRRAFLLSQLDGLTYQEIAERMNLSVSSIKKYMARAIEHCLLFSLT